MQRLCRSIETCSVCVFGGTSRTPSPTERTRVAEVVVPCGENGMSRATARVAPTGKRADRVVRPYGRENVPPAYSHSCTPRFICRRQRFGGKLVARSKNKTPPNGWCFFWIFKYQPRMFN